MLLNQVINQAKGTEIYKKLKNTIEDVFAQ